MMEPVGVGLVPASLTAMVTLRDCEAAMLVDDGVTVTVGVSKAEAP
jgi:hypothetical protein